MIPKRRKEKTNNGGYENEPSQRTAEWDTSIIVSKYHHSTPLTHSLQQVPRDSNRAGAPSFASPIPLPARPLRISCPPPSAHLLLRLPRHHNKDSLYCHYQPTTDPNTPINNIPSTTTLSLPIIEDDITYHISTFSRQK
jgi:hypothetical protein